MGVPRQELWVSEHLKSLAVAGLHGRRWACSISIQVPSQGRQDGCGGLGIEWIWRLLMEPRRMWKRYIIGNVGISAEDSQKSKARGAHKRSIMNMEPLWTSPPSLPCKARRQPFGFPACFLPLMGKAFPARAGVYRTLGIQNLDIYLSQYADDLEKFIGDGRNVWGVHITYHLLKQRSSVLARIARDINPTEDLFLLCNNLQLPFITKEQLTQPVSFRDTSTEGAELAGAYAPKSSWKAASLPQWRLILKRSVSNRPAPSGIAQAYSFPAKAKAFS